jgi:hypothetical protein
MHTGSARRKASEFYAMTLMLLGLAVVWGGLAWLAVVSLWG